MHKGSFYFKDACKMKEHFGYFFYCGSPYFKSQGTPVSRKWFANKIAWAVWECAKESSRCCVLFLFIYFPKLLSRGKTLMGEKRSSHLLVISASMVSASLHSTLAHY